MRSHSELAALIGHRNHLASYMRRPGSRGAAALGAVALRPPQAPPMLQESYSCIKCPLASTCAVYHKASRELGGLLGDVRWLSRAWLVH